MLVMTLMMFLMIFVINHKTTSTSLTSSLRRA